MKNVGRITAIAVAMVVVLRMAIGWQMFYEGVWKLKTLTTPQPWSAVGYLKNSQGPLRNTFRTMAGDPDELGWLDESTVAAKWDDWRQRFETHYQLDEDQKRRLSDMLVGPKEFVSDKGQLATLPEGVVDFNSLKTRVAPGDEGVVNPIRYDAGNQRLVVDGRTHLSSKERDKLLSPWKGVAREDKSAEVLAFEEAVEKVYARSTKLSYRERLKAAVSGDPNIVGRRPKGRLDQLGELEKYKVMLADYETGLANAKTSYQHDHLDRLWSDIQAQRAALVGPIKTLDKELKDEAQARLRVDQMQRGEVSQPWTGLRISDTLTILGLACLGFLLIVGLFTRFAAVMGAIMIFMFYMAMPPWPGLPEAPGPEHSLIVNKNLIEVIALVAIAALPTGYWFGLDKLVCRVFAGRKTKAVVAPA